jgi:DNA polymerase-1
MIIKTEQELDSCIDKFKNSEILAIDCETSRIKNTRIWELTLYGIGVHNGSEGVYIPNHQDVYPLDISKVQELFTNKTLVFHNAKFDLMVLEGHSFDFSTSAIHDTMIMSYLGNENTNNKLKDLAERVLEMKDIVHFDDVDFDFGRDQKSLFEDRDVRGAIDKMGEYCIDDVLYTIKLYKYYLKDLREQGLWKLYNDLERKLISIMKNMTMRGVKIDEKYLLDMDHQLSVELGKLTGDICKGMGKKLGEINLKSATQVANYFFEDQKLPIGAKSEKTSKWLLNRDKLEEIKELHYKVTNNGGVITKDQEKVYKNCSAVAMLMLRSRKLTKLKTTYTAGILSAAHKGVIHAKFSGTSTVTGRWSSSAINLQNIPTDTKYDVRKAFMAREGYKFIIADHSQIELRILAHCSKDKHMLEVYRNNGDIHQQTADVVGCTRRDAKEINFGIIYGMGAASLAYSINKHKEVGEKLFTKQDAQRFMNKYLDSYPGVGLFMENAKKMAYKDGFVRNILGRKRRLSKWLYGKDFELKARAERQAMNFLIQSGAADILKIAIKNIDKIIKDRKLGMYLLIQIHDELIYEVLESQVERGSKIIKYLMEEAGSSLSVPLITEPKVSDHWIK